MAHPLRLFGGRWRFVEAGLRMDCPGRTDPLNPDGIGHMFIPRRPFATIAVAGALAVISGCDPTGPQSSPASLGDASFTVVSVNDTTTPYLTSAGDCQVLHCGSRMTFYASGRYTAYINYGTDLCGGKWAGQSLWATSGTYTKDGSKLTLHPDGTGGTGEVASYSATGGSGVSPHGEVQLPQIVFTINGQKFTLDQEATELLH